jgi:hypothetical protein
VGLVPAKKRLGVSSNRFRIEQPDRTAWWNVVVSVVAVLVLIGTLPFLSNGTEIETRFGPLLSLVGLGVILKWGYWRNPSLTRRLLRRERSGGTTRNVPNPGGFAPAEAAGRRRLWPVLAVS